MVKSLVQTRSKKNWKSPKSNTVTAPSAKATVSKTVTLPIKVVPAVVLVDRKLLSTSPLLYLLNTLESVSTVRNIKDKSILVTALKELQGLIGMKTVKDSIAKQVMCLIESGPGTDMLHTVIYGPPGTGKTTVGNILCKVYIALGILTGLPGGPVKTDSTKDSESSEPPRRSKRNRTLTIQELNAVEECLGTSSDDSESDLKDFVVPDEPEYDYDCEPMLIAEGLHEESSEHTSGSDSLEHSSESEPTTHTGPFRVVSRPDFISKYVGETCAKTKKLLNSSVGKVLFIDEAYSLCTSDEDTYGSEALTVLNQFMSERPRDVIIIFAGYKDNLKRTIFRDQPGLERRCSWFHEVSEYTAKELRDIFEFQSKSQGMTVPDTLGLFELHRESLKNYGGDTLKILMYAKLERSLDKFEHSLHPDYKQDNTLCTKHIETAFKILQENNMSTRDGGTGYNMMYV